MSTMIHGVILPNKGLDAITITALPVEVPVNSIALYLIDPASDQRQLEIDNGWRWLWNGVRDRNLLDIQFNGALLYTAVPLDNIVAAGRKTSSQFLDVEAGDIGLGISAETTALFRGAVTPLEVAFQQLRDRARELVFKVV